MSEGLTILPYYKNEATGTMEPWEGRDAVDNYITTDEVDCTNVGTDVVVAITSGFKGYVTFLSMYNSNAAAQTFVLEDTSGIKKTLTIGTLETVTWIGENPFIVLSAGNVTGTAGTGNHIQVTMTYFERKA